MSEWVKQTEDASYLKAVKTTESLDSPAVGFIKTTELKSTFDFQKVLVRQNNTLISLIVDLNSQIQDLKQ